MSEFHCEVIQVGKVEKHPNADSLSITVVHDAYPVIFRTGDFHEGDLAIYIPVDAVVPDTTDWAFLDKRRIKAKKLRGVFSMGMLANLSLATKGLGFEDTLHPGDDCAEALGITKYEPEMATPRGRALSKTDGLQVPAPTCFKALPGVYDIEPFRKYGNHWFKPGELVVVTEKIHGQNASFVSDGENLYIKSRTRWLKDEGSTWSRIADRFNLKEKLKDYPGIVFFGEAYGNNSDMPYGEDGTGFRVFDVFHTDAPGFVSHPLVEAVCRNIGLDMVPVLAYGRWGEDVTFDSVMAMAEGKSTLADHVREGVVIKPVAERQTDRFERVILKVAGEGYLTRKGA